MDRTRIRVLRSDVGEVRILYCLIATDFGGSGLDDRSSPHSMITLTLPKVQVLLHSSIHTNIEK